MENPLPSLPGFFMPSLSSQTIEMRHWGLSPMSGFNRLFGRGAQGSELSARNNSDELNGSADFLRGVADEVFNSGNKQDGIKRLGKEVVRPQL